jgi:YidC/Oxa1 family membrane protein insertase
MKFDKNTAIGFTMMILLLLGFTWYQADLQKKQQEAEQVILDSLAREQAAAPVAVPAIQPEQPQLAQATVDSVGGDSLRLAQANQALVDRFGILAPAAQGEEGRAVLQNKRLKIEIDNKGGLFASAELLDGYKNYTTGENIKLWSEGLSSMQFDLNLVGKGVFSSRDFYFVPNTTVVDASAAEGSLTMRLNSADPAKYFEIVYTLKPDAYAVDMKINAHGIGDDLQLSAKPLTIAWNVAGMANEKGLSAERSRCSVYYREGEEDRDYLSESDDDSYTAEDPMKWVAFKQDYFTAAVIAKEGFNAGSYVQVNVPTDSLHTKLYQAKLQLPVKGGAHAFGELTFYFGPNDYKELKSLDVEEIDRVIDYGWSIIGTVNRYCVRPLFWFFSSFIGSWGLIILLVTLVIKTVLFPITWKNFLSSAKMRVLKPEIDEINKKYADKDPMQKQTATMALYRQTGVNPFAGCLPVLLQMPILYAMFRFFPAEIVLRGKSFLWADDLAAYDSILSWDQHIPILSSIYGNHVSGFTILMCISTFFYSKMSMGSQPQMAQQPGMPNMTVMMNIFTVMMLFFFNGQPSGLSLYYFIANMVSIGQMWMIRKYFIDENAIRSKIEENKKKPQTKSSFMQRLEEAQKQQRQKLAQQKK